MTIKKLNEILQSNFSHVLFTYNNKECGIDPFSMSEFDVWCGDNIKKVNSIDEISLVPIFDGKPLIEVIAEITDIDY